MSVLADIGGVINDVRLIIQSNPERLNDFAQRWAQVGGAAQGQQPVVMRGITDVEFNSEGALSKSMTEYRLQMGDGMAKLGDGTMEVADALRQAAPKLAAIRKDLIAAAVGAGLTVAALAIPVVGEVLEGLVAGGEIVTIVNLVNDYNTEMTALNGSFTTAQAKMAALDTLNNNGGVLPDAPAVNPDDAGQNPAGDPSGAGTGSGGGGGGSGSGAGAGTGAGSQSPGGQSPGGDMPGDSTGGTTPSSDMPGSDPSTGTTTPSSFDSANSDLGTNPLPTTDPSLSSSLPSTLDTTTPNMTSSGLTPSNLGTTHLSTTPNTLSSSHLGTTPSTFMPSSFTPFSGTSASRNPSTGRESSSSTGVGSGGEPGPSLSRGPVPGGSSGATAGGGGFIPPMMPPMAGGGMGGGGVRAGEAGSRGGSAMRAGGRDGRRAALRPQLAGRSRDRDEKQPAETFPPTDGNLLDEELWQVPGGAPLPEPPEPGRRRPARGA